MPRLETETGTRLAKWKRMLWADMSQVGRLEGSWQMPGIFVGTYSLHAAGVMKDWGEEGRGGTREVQVEIIWVEVEGREVGWGTVEGGGQARHVRRK